MENNLYAGFHEFNECVSTRGTLVVAFQEFISEVISMAEEADSSCNSSEIKKLARTVSEISATQRAVKEACASAKNYAEHLSKFFYIGKEDEKRDYILDQLRKGNPTPLETFYNDICKHLMDAQDKYSTFESDCREASKTSGKAADACKEEGKRLNRNKKIGSVVGGTVATAGVGTGIVLSAVAGIFTFGVGTVVGLATTAAVATTAGVATGIGTGVYAVDCHFAERNFNKISKNFDSLTRKADSLNDEVHKAHKVTKKMQDLANQHFKREIEVVVQQKIVVNVFVTLEKAQNELDDDINLFKRTL